MKFHVLTLFPEIPRAFFESSIMAKAVQREIIAYNLVNVRDFAFNKHRSCDDKPYGAVNDKHVPGMLMLPEPLALALESVGVFPEPGFFAESGNAEPAEVPPEREASPKKRVIYVTPSGKPLTQALAEELAGEDELVFVCGRYEGIDQRIIDAYVDDEISIGDYVMSSGELAATVIIDTVYRLIDGVISSESLEDESFSDGFLEYPQYTRPEIFRGVAVPEVLLSGHHENIRRWRLRKRIEKTISVRPDLIREARASGFLSKETEKIIKEIEHVNGTDSQDRRGPEKG
jgi:tRNA (guanine37-N1)-methyltransferase